MIGTPDDATPAHFAPDAEQGEHFEVLPVGPDIGLTEVVRAAQQIDREHPGWRPEVVWSQAAAVIAESSPGVPLARFLAEEQAGLSDCPDQAMLIEMIAATERMVSHYTAMQAAVIEELMMHRENSLRSVTSVADEISARLAVTPYAGGTAVSRSLELADSPALREGLASGDLSGRKVDVIGDAVLGLETEERVAITEYGCQLAGTHTPPQLKKALATAVVAADPQRAEERHQAEVQRRHVRFDQAAHGMAWLSIYTRAEEALTMYTCIDSLAAHTAATDQRGIDARRADALTDVFDSIMATGRTPDGTALPTQHGQRPHLRLTATVPVLAGDARTPALLHGYGPVTADTARSFAQRGVVETQQSAPGARAPTPAAEHQKVCVPKQREERRPLVGADPMSELIPPARPPDDPDGTDPSELADWLGRAIGHRTMTATRAPVLLEEELGIMATDAYAPSGRLRAHIVERDQTCRFPTCQVPAWRCQLDHISPFTTELPAWAQTTETNLHALCTHHHQLKTRGDLTSARDARTGVTSWRTSTGHVYMRAPEPADYEAVSAHLRHAAELVVCEPPPQPYGEPPF